MALAFTIAGACVATEPQARAAASLPVAAAAKLRLPAHWRGRFLFQGGGGLDGFVAPAVGFIGNGSTPALACGFAVISSDGGHEGMSAEFAADQQARLDYAYAGRGPVAMLGKRLIARYYGRPPRTSYFAGCSNGGREAMMIAERCPTATCGWSLAPSCVHATRSMAC